MSGEPTLRGRLAVVMSRFPAVTETFILRELVELDRLGVGVELVPLLRDRVSVLHPDAAPWDEIALYTPFLSGPIVAENLRALLRSPRRYLAVLFALLWEARSSWNAFTGVLGIFPKSVYNGRRVRERGVTHVHAHYATHPAAAAYIMSRVHGPDEPDLPYSLTLHAHDIFITKAGLPRKLGAAAFVRSISRFNVDYLKRVLGAGCPPEDRFRVIHCGIEPERYRNRPLDGEPGRARTARVLCIAAHRPYKGLTHLIEAFRILAARAADVRCDVIGEGHLRPQLEAQIERAGIAKSFALVGTKTQEEVAQSLAECDLFVLPSVVADDGQMEGIPVSLMEALAAGVPTLSTRISGIPELVVPGQTGFLVEPADPEALADAIQAILRDYAAARALAQNGRALVQSEFDLRENVRRLVAEVAAVGTEES